MDNRFHQVLWQLWHISPVTFSSSSHADINIVMLLICFNMSFTEQIKNYSTLQCTRTVPADLTTKDIINKMTFFDGVLDQEIF